MQSLMMKQVRYYTRPKEGSKSIWGLVIIILYSSVSIHLLHHLHCVHHCKQQSDSITQRKPPALMVAPWNFLHRLFGTFAHTMDVFVFHPKWFFCLLQSSLKASPCTQERGNLGTPLWILALLYIDPQRLCSLLLGKMEIAHKASKTRIPQHWTHRHWGHAAFETKLQGLHKQEIHDSCVYTSPWDD